MQAFTRARKDSFWDPSKIIVDKSLKNCPEKPAFGTTCFSVCITSLKKNKKIITNRKGGAGGRWSYFIFQHSDLCKQTQVLLPINRPRSCCLQDYQTDVLKSVHTLHTPTSLFQLQKKAKKKKAATARRRRRQQQTKPRTHPFLYAPVHTSQTKQLPNNIHHGTSKISLRLILPS